MKFSPPVFYFGGIVMNIKRRLSTISVITAVLLLISSLISFADEGEQDLLDTEDITASEEAIEITSDNTEEEPELQENAGEAEMDTDPDEANPEEDLKDLSETEIVPKKSSPDPAEKTSDQKKDPAPVKAETNSPSNSDENTFKIVATRVRDSGFADVSDLQIPAEKEEDLSLYLSTSDLSDVSIYIDGDIIVACEIVLEDPEGEVEEPLTPARTPSAEPEGDFAVSYVSELAISEMPEDISPEIAAAESSEDLLQEGSAEEPLGSFMCVLVFLAEAIKHLIQYLV